MTNLVMAKDRLQLLGINELYNWDEMHLKCVFNELLMWMEIDQWSWKCDIGFFSLTCRTFLTYKIEEYNDTHLASVIISRSALIYVYQRLANYSPLANPSPLSIFINCQTATLISLYIVQLLSCYRDRVEELIQRSYNSQRLLKCSF